MHSIDWGGKPLTRATLLYGRAQKMYPKMLSLNDLSIQNHLFDRRWVYKLCDENNIPTPRHVFCNRGEDLAGSLMHGMVPTEDFPKPWPSSELEVCQHA
jgi:hypothetical protein